MIGESHTARSAWPKRAAWAAIFLVALALRAYRITGWVLDYDESHWLLYILQPELLLKTEGSSYARPDCLFAWLGTLSTQLLGSNELALRLWPVLFGALSVFPLGWFVTVWTKNNAAGKWAAALLAVSPLSIWISAQAVPDAIAIFFVLYGLVGFAYMTRTPPRPIHFLTLGLGMSLAILSKATALYLWLLLGLVGWIFLPARRDRVRYYISLFTSLVPFAVMLAIIKWHGSPLTFLEQPTVRSEFRIDLSRILQQFNLFIRLFIVNLLPMAAGVWVAWRQDRKWLLWLANLALIVVTPTFRVLARELLYLVPAVGLFSGLAVEALPTGRVRSVALGCLLTISLVLDLWGVPISPQGASFSGQTTAVLARPSDWPSREATNWLLAHLSHDEAILIIGLGFTDPVVIRLSAAGITMYGAARHWEFLRDPASRIKYAVFVDNHALYAPQFTRYSDTHFTIPADAHFPGYTIYDCQKDGRFVAYPDALDSAEAYIRRGSDLLQQHQCAQAINALETALQLDPTAVEAARGLMQADLACGHPEDAARVGRGILQRDPADRQVNANMAMLDLQLGLIEDGLAQCRKNIQLNITPAISYGVLGQLLERQGDLKAARDAYEQSLSSEPTNGVTLNLLANVVAKLAQKPPP